jgi:hypothetical protein
MSSAAPAQCQPWSDHFSLQLYCVDAVLVQLLLLGNQVYLFAKCFAVVTRDPAGLKPGNCHVEQMVNCSQLSRHDVTQNGLSVASTTALLCWRVPIKYRQRILLLRRGPDCWPALIHWRFRVWYKFGIFDVFIKKVVFGCHTYYINKLALQAPAWTGTWNPNVVFVLLLDVSGVFVEFFHTSHRAGRSCMCLPCCDAF